MIPRPSKRFLLFSTSTKRACSGESSPKKISGSRWNSVSPSNPPTAKATMIEREEGSILGGHRARRKSMQLSHLMSYLSTKQLSYWAVQKCIVLPTTR